MKKIAIKTSILFVFLAMTAIVSAQVNTLYYMKTVSTRSDINPAFQSLPNVYVEIPGISGIYFAGGNNSLILHDVIFPKNGIPVTFLNSKYGDKDKFYDQLKKKRDFRIFTEAQIDRSALGSVSKRKTSSPSASQKKSVSALPYPKTCSKWDSTAPPTPLT